MRGAVAVVDGPVVPGARAVAAAVVAAAAAAAAAAVVRRSDGLSRGGWGVWGVGWVGPTPRGEGGEGTGRPPATGVPPAHRRHRWRRPLPLVVLHCVCHGPWTEKRLRL